MNLYPLRYKAYIFDLDNTIYPEKDYLYQVYYLIGKYIEEKEKASSKEITEFLVYQFEKSGRKNLLNKLLDKFSLPESYMEDMLEIMRTAKLPLKLHMFKPVFELMQELVSNKLKIYILTNGNPGQQLNKIKHIEWLGLEDQVTCYFANEICPKPAPDALNHILTTHSIEKDDVILIGDSKEDEYCAKAAGVFFMDVKELIS